jgi:16S rRNA A1518/A1519 N6-dimethyltransferase RsmA/KsgA/DIM1 with predicted DNA glycosylase/AP lyase activity
VQGDLFGMPPCDSSQSQWFTPMWLARRIARWVPAHARTRVLEPACGSGNLVAALLEVDPKQQVVALELDPRMAEQARLRCGVDVVCHDFLKVQACDLPPCDLAVMNPPFEGNGHLEFVKHALKFVPAIVGVFPSAFEFPSV